MKAGSAKTRPYKTQGLRQFALLIVFNPFAFGYGKWGESQNLKQSTALFASKLLLLLKLVSQDRSQLQRGPQSEGRIVVTVKNRNR